MRTVVGRTDRVVIVGAGLGGLSTALRLAAAGREVVVLEREAEPGGRAGVYRAGGYTFDTGPTVLTLPHLISDAFECVGERLDDWLDLRPVKPLYRAFFADGSQIDLHSDVDAMAAAIEDLCGPAEATGYREFVHFVSALYRLEMKQFIDRNLDSPFAVITPDLARLAAIGGFRRLAPKIEQFLKDGRIQRIFTFQSMYAGLAPHQALALYGVISYMDTIGGVYFPVGGIHAVAAALAGAAEKHGVRIHYGTEVTGVQMNGSRASAVVTATGERLPADVVVLNPDLPVAYRTLLGREPRRIRRLKYSPSCFVMLAGSRASYPAAAHHNIYFGNAWRQVCDDIMSKRLMSDPSFMVTVPSRSDPALAPPGRHSYYILFPAPNTDADIDWAETGPAYRDEVIRVLERRCYPAFGDAIEVERVTTPADWQALGMERGTPFAASHTPLQTGPFRPGNLYGENVVFTGSGTRPGVGVPMVLLSGRLAAERITG